MTRVRNARGSGRHAQSARLQAIKADILARLGQRDLTVGAVAARHCLTARQVQRLFASEGLTFSQFVLDERLARAHALLSDPRQAQLPVSSIAFDLGFGDLSYFNRAFRRRFGASPSQVRAAAQPGNGT